MLPVLRLLVASFVFACCNASRQLHKSNALELGWWCPDNNAEAFMHLKRYAGVLMLPHRDVDRWPCLSDEKLAEGTPLALKKMMDAVREACGEEIVMCAEDGGRKFVENVKAASAEVGRIVKCMAAKEGVDEQTVTAGITNALKAKALSTENQACGKELPPVDEAPNAKLLWELVSTPFEK